jgi:hypothetical protein
VPHFNPSLRIRAARVSPLAWAKASCKASLLHFHAVSIAPRGVPDWAASAGGWVSVSDFPASSAVASAVAARTGAELRTASLVKRKADVGPRALAHGPASRRAMTSSATD